jgi:predicted ATP-binding protein involved in virulence
MEEIFVTKVRINKVRHLESLEIPLSDTERKHLILTGKNGSGKTSVLEGIVTFLNNILADSFPYDENTLLRYIGETFGRLKSLREIEEEDIVRGTANEFNHRRSMIRMEVGPRLKQIEEKYPVQLFSETDLYDKNGSFQQRTLKKNVSFLIKYFTSKRDFQPYESSGPQKIEQKDLYDIKEEANKNFVRQMVNLRLDLLDSKDRGHTGQAERIEKWFQIFEQTLKDIFKEDSLKLVFDRPNFNYNIIIKNRQPFNLNQLSDGYAAFVAIVSELMMRMNKTDFSVNKFYELQGIVLIDEIETHLHIDLQKKILPFLTTFFPKIQFIVTTHSPFVLSSIDNAVIYDLEKQIRVEDLSGYSYTNIVKGYFDADEYSKEVKDKIAEYEQLIAKSHHDTNLLTLEEKAQYYELKRYFEELPKTLSPELQLRIQQLELAQLAQ